MNSQKLQIDFTVLHTTVIDFTLLHTTVLELAAEQPDYVYQWPEVQGCSYFACKGATGQENGCIFGRALHRMGITLPRAVEGIGIQFLIDHVGALIEKDNYICWFSLIQDAQDDAYPWNECITIANSEVKLN